MKFAIFRSEYDFSKFNPEWLYLFDDDFFYDEFQKIEQLKVVLKDHLKKTAIKRFPKYMSNISYR